MGGTAMGASEMGATEMGATEMGGTTPTKQASNGALPDDLPHGLVLAYSQFEVENGQATARPGPARVELLSRQGGQWVVETIEDADSNVFHKAMVFTPRSGDNQAPGILTLAGNQAAVKLWRRGEGGAWSSTTAWTEEFGGRHNRMRDAEIADLYGDGKPALAIATHDQGVLAILRDLSSEPVRLDRKPDTFIHEIEVGDVNGDGKLEVYATPSEPNRAEGGAQHGEVVRYVPTEEGGARTVVADLGNRHAKEIYVGDVDGDGRDELYVAVEALTSREGGSLQITEPVEIRRYDADTPADGGVVVATINDRFTRFLTVGDVDGDGKKEMIAASFRAGIWLLRPGSNPRGEWGTESVDRDSGGFEHAALLTDLDADGRDELYVSSDTDGEIRRYVWRNGRSRREVIHRREIPRAMMTWNIMPFPTEMVQ